MSANSPAILRTGKIVAAAILVCAAGGLSAARAEIPLHTPGAIPVLQLAQGNAVWCRDSAARIRSLQSRHESSCSGSLSQQQYARCRQMQRELNDAFARHNASCR